MQFQISIFSLLTISSLASAVRVTYDNGYDNAARPLTDVACSDGSNGLITKGFTTQGSLPNFPHIGGASTVSGWNSPSCGTCYTLTWEGKSITILAVDHAAVGFNIGQIALDELTSGRAVELGGVDVEWIEVASAACGL